MASPVPNPTQSELDERFMREALRLARAAVLAEEVPIGAVVVSATGVVLGRGFNRTLTDIDPSAHAEIVALREAAWRAGNHRLLGCTLYATIEPCAMCAGALIQARVARVVFGADDPKAGALGSVLQLGAMRELNHRFAVTAGILAEECGSLLTAFFRGKRRDGAEASERTAPTEPLSPAS